MYRKQIEKIKNDLDKKMVFVVGPRQVGKTWLSKKIGAMFENPAYLNFDSVDDREIIMKEQWPKKTDLLILDELHKMKGWKNFLKGVYDTKPEGLKILVTGSARLNTFRQVGDSLAGRYFLHRLLPFSLAETKEAGSDIGMEKFLQRGGFPEPLLAESEEDALRWRNQYIDGLIRTDILDFEIVHDLRAVQTVMELLRRKVGSPVSYSSISRDAQISPVTVKKYIEIFENLYIIFRVLPFSKKISRAILKEPKIYFFDTGMVIGDEGAILENFTAVSFLKHAHAIADHKGEIIDLNYIRTKEDKEVDFVLAKNGAINQLIEVKTSDKAVSKNLKFFSDKYNLKAIQLVKELKREKSVDNIDVVEAEEYLKGLFL
jgi:uncharacterized protein